MKKIKLLTLLFLLTVLANAQIKLIGTVLNKNSNIPIGSATICLNAKKYTTTSNKGRFEFALSSADSVQLKITHIGFKKFSKWFRLPSKKRKIYLPTIHLIPDNVELGEIKIKGKGVLERVKGDTLEYNVRLLKMDKYDTAKELVEAIPGVYRNESGQLIAKNKRVKIVTIDGKQLYKNKINETLEALPADVIAKVQIYDDYDELGKFCGFIMDNNVVNSAINLVTKYPNLTLALGNYSACGGTKKKYKLVGNNTFLLKNNNININEHLSTFPSFRTFSNKVGYPKEYMFKRIQSSLANQTKNMQLFVDGDYSIKDKTQQTNTSTNYYNENRYNETQSKLRSENNKGVLNTAMDFSINRKNKVFLENNYSELDIESSIEKQQNQMYNGEEILNSNYLVNYRGNTKTMNNHIVSRSLLTTQTYLECNLLSNYSKTESFSINEGTINNEFKKNEQKIEQKDHKLIFKPKLIFYKNRNCFYNLNYDLVYQQYNYDNQINNYQLNYLANTFKLKSKFNINKFNIDYDFGYRIVKSVDSPIKVQYTEWAGDIDVKMNLGNYNFRVDYNRDTRTPTIYQLYDFYDNKNPFNVKLGNKDLKQEEINTFRFLIGSIKYNKLNYYITYKYINNYIVSNSVLVKQGEYMGKEYTNGTLINTFGNTNGYWSLALNVSWRLPILINVQYNYSYIPNYYDGLKNFTKSNNLNLSLRWKYYRNKNFSLKITSLNSYRARQNSILNISSNYYFSNNSLYFTLNKILGATLKIKYYNLISFYKIKQSKAHVDNYVDLTIRKPLFKSNFDLSLEVKDLFNNGKTKQNEITKDYFKTINTDIYNRLFLLKLSYKFKKASARSYYGLKTKVHSINRTSNF